MSERQIRRISQLNEKTERVLPEQLRRLGLGTEAPLERQVEGTSAYPNGTSNSAAIAGAFHDAADDAARGARDVSVRGKSPFTFDGR